MKLFNFILVAALLIFASCNSSVKSNDERPLSPIMEKALSGVNSPFYADFANFPKERNDLPIGVFDSGTGGLTVLEVLLKSDMVNNITGELGADGIPDFAGESFSYVADRANMPYGNYAAENKQEFFKELVVKDALFLLSDKYYLNSVDKEAKGKKMPSKILVIACNTATAWGLEDVKLLLEKSNTGVKVIGVINAGVNALLDKVEDEIGRSASMGDSLSVGVLATVGTISSDAYKRTILEQLSVREYAGGVAVVNQPGAGFAEAVDGEKDFVDITISSPRGSYRGPVLGGGDNDIKEELLPVYNFDYSGNNLLYKKENGRYVEFQLNSAANYARFHLVSLVDKLKNSGSRAKLRSVILGCTHYPFLLDTLSAVIEELRNYRDESGVLVYGDLIASNFEFIDPAVYTALECYTALRESNELALNPLDGKLDAYISVPVFGLPSDCLDADGNLAYSFKYGRDYGTNDITTLFVPFSRRYIDDVTLNRIETMLPASYSMIKQIIK